MSAVPPDPGRIVASPVPAGIRIAPSHGPSVMGAQQLGSFPKLEQKPGALSCAASSSVPCWFAGPLAT